MKKLILMFSMIIVTIITISCGDSMDVGKCMMTVQATFPKATVFALPDSKFKYIVIDTLNNVYYVKTMSLNTTKITTTIQISR